MGRTYLWFAQIVTGAILVIFLGIHMVMMHLDDILGFFGTDIGEPASWTSIMERADQGLWLGFYIAFLALVLYHGLNGLHGVIFELSLSPRGEQITTRVIVALGIIAFGLGTYVPLILFAG